MKPLKFAACTLLLVPLLLAACSSDAEVEAADQIAIVGLEEYAEKGISFSYSPTAEEEVRFSIVSNKTWSIARDNCDWLTVSQMNGGSKLPASVRISALANDDLMRSGSLTIRAGHVTQTIEVRQEAFPIVPELTLDGLTDNRIGFAFSDIAPVLFTIGGNVAWTAEKQGLEWADISPLEGERRKKVEISVTPEANAGAARSGELVFRAEGLEPIVVTISQTALPTEPFRTLTGIENGRITFPYLPTAPVSFDIHTNRDWEIVPQDLDWLAATPLSGAGGPLPATVTLTAQRNRGEPRTGRLVLRSADPALADIEIEVAQESKQDILLAQWSLVSSIMKPNEAKWVDEGEMIVDLPVGSQATAKWQQVSGFKSTFLFPSKSPTNHYVIRTIWTDDNMEFDIPVSHLPAGSRVGIRYGAYGAKGAPKYWMVEYFDGGQWRPTSTQTFTDDFADAPFEATYCLEKVNTTFDIDEIATFSQAIDDGSVRIRVRVVEGQCMISIATPKTKPETGGARFVPWSNGKNNAISFRLIAEDED